MKFRLLALVCVFVSLSAGAVEVPTLYTAQVPMDRQQRDPQGTAYRTALAQVVQRVAGSQLVNDVDLFDAMFPDASAFVVSYRPGPDQTLFVSFDGEALEQVLRNSGQRVWGSNRPLTMVWLAVDWGGGDRELIGATDAEQNPDEARSINRHRLLRQRVVEFAQSLGLPVAFPLLDSEDLRNVSFSDVWGGFDERIVAASQRYDVNSVLIGRVRASDGLRDRWTYHFAGEQYAWSGEPEFVLTQVTDLLAAEFAIGGDAPLRAVELKVSGVASVEAFGRLHNVLDTIPVVDSFAITSVMGDRVSYRVVAHGGAARLARALRIEGLIEQERIESELFPRDDASASLEFFYSP